MVQFGAIFTKKNLFVKIMWIQLRTRV